MRRVVSMAQSEMQGLNEEGFLMITPMNCEEDVPGIG